MPSHCPAQDFGYGARIIDKNREGEIAGFNLDVLSDWGKVVLSSVFLPLVFRLKASPAAPSPLRCWRLLPVAHDAPSQPLVARRGFFLSAPEAPRSVH
jgi:hypothetical protein